MHAGCMPPGAGPSLSSLPACHPAGAQPPPSLPATARGKGTGSVPATAYSNHAGCTQLPQGQFFPDIIIYQALNHSSCVLGKTSSPLPVCHTRVQPSPPPGTLRLCRKAAAGTSQGQPHHGAPSQSSGMPWEPAGSWQGWEQEAGTRVLHKAPQARSHRLLGQESGHPLPRFRESPIPRVLRVLGEQRGSSLAMEQGAITQPQTQPSSPLPWNVEPPHTPRLSPQSIYHRSCTLTASQPPACCSFCSPGTGSAPRDMGTAGGHLLHTPLPLNRHLSPLCLPRGDQSDAPAALGCPHCARRGCGSSDGARSPQPHAPTGSGLPEQDRDPRLRCPTGTFPPGLHRAMCCAGSCPCPVGVSRAKGLAAARSPVLPPATLQAGAVPSSHGHPPVPSEAKTPHEGREKTASLSSEGSGKKCCVTRGTAKTNRAWQPDTAPGQGAQTAPAGCGMRTDRQGRGSPQQTPCRALVANSCPWRRVARGAHPQRALLTVGTPGELPWTSHGRREWSCDLALGWTGTNTAPAPSASQGAPGDPAWGHRARPDCGPSHGVMLLPSSRGHGPHHSLQDGEGGEHGIQTH